MKDPRGFKCATCGLPVERPCGSTHEALYRECFNYKTAVLRKRAPKPEDGTT
jgi:hypothetical protein